MNDNAAREAEPVTMRAPTIRRDTLIRYALWLGGMAASLAQKRLSNIENNHGDSVNTETIISFLLQALLFYFVFNAFVIGLMLYMRNASRAALNWPSAPGKIKSSRVHYKSSYGKTDPTPWVEYTYEVAGKAYQSMSISPDGMLTNDAQQADELVARYPKGADVTVYYNPAKPANACLQKEPVGEGPLRGALILGNLAMPFIVLLVRFLSSR